MSTVLIEIIDDKAMTELKKMESKKLIKFQKAESIIEPASK